MTDTASPDSNPNQPTPSSSAKDAKPGFHPWGLLALLVVLGTVAYFPSTRVALRLVLAYAPVLLCYQLAIWWVSYLVGATTMEVAIGFASQVIGVRIGGTILSVRWLPLGSYVKHFGFDDLPSETGTRATPNPGNSPVSYHDLHPLRRVAICLAGPAVSLLIAVALLGIEGFWSFLRGFEQSLLMPWRSREQVADLVRPFLNAMEQGDWIFAIGTIAAKNAANNLIPFSTNVGGMAVLALIEWFRGRPLPARLRIYIEYLCLLVLLVYGFFGVRVAWFLVTRR